MLRLLVGGLAVWLATVLVTTQELFRPLREAAERTHPRLGYLSRCPWCAGTWLGFGVALLGGGAFGDTLRPRDRVAPAALLDGLAYQAVARLVDRAWRRLGAA